MVIFEINPVHGVSQSPVRKNKQKTKKTEQTPAKEHYIKHRFSELFKDCTKNTQLH